MESEKKRAWERWTVVAAVVWLIAVQVVDALGYAEAAQLMRTLGTGFQLGEGEPLGASELVAIGAFGRGVARLIRARLDAKRLRESTVSPRGLA